MARSASIVSDSDGKPDDVQAPEDDTTKSVALNGENEEEDDDDEEEFEIEEVLKHNKGQFPEVHFLSDFPKPVQLTLVPGLFREEWVIMSNGKITDQNTTAGSTSKMLGM